MVTNFDKAILMRSIIMRSDFISFFIPRDCWNTVPIQSLKVFLLDDVGLLRELHRLFRSVGGLLEALLDVVVLRIACSLQAFVRVVPLLESAEYLVQQSVILLKILGAI